MYVAQTINSVPNIIRLEMIDCGIGAEGCVHVGKMLAEHKKTKVSLSRPDLSCLT